MNIYYEEEEVQKLLDSYQKLLNIRIAVLNSEFIGLYHSPSHITTFCKKVRQNSNVNRVCKECDQIAYKKAKHIEDTYIYKCHLGLYEAITPIKDEGSIIGYLMIGQVLDEKDTKIQWKELLKKEGTKYSNLIFCEKDYHELKNISLDHFQAMSIIMKACAHSILLSHIVHIEKSPITDLISGYIQRYYNESISIERISLALNISRTTIYNYMKKEYNMSLIQYLNKYRLEKSKILLETTTECISKIADSVGYDNYVYYTRLFKEEYRCTPSQYRRIKTIGLK